MKQRAKIGVPTDEEIIEKAEGGIDRLLAVNNDIQDTLETFDKKLVKVLE